MTTSTTRPGSARRPVDWVRLLGSAALAALAAVVANGLLYLVGSALGAFPADVFIEPGQPLTLVPVVFASIVGVVGATVVFAIMARFLARPVRPFRILAAVLLVLSFASPFGIPDATPSMIVWLNLMHVVTAVIAVLLLTGRFPADTVTA